MNINLELYKIFYHVALNGSFTRAANELMISQPAISRSIKTLEEQLNITLFVRNHDGITLSKAGKKIFEKVKIAMKQIESIDDDISELEEKYNFTVSIGTTNNIAKNILIPYIKEFHEKYPNIKIKIYSSSPSFLEKDIQNSVIDCAVSTFPLSLISKYERIKICELEDGAFVAKKYEYLLKKNIKLKDLENLPVLLITKGTNSRAQLDDFFKENDINIKPEMELSGTQLIKIFTESDFGIGIMPKQLLKEELESNKLKELSLEKPLTKRDVTLIYAKDKAKNIGIATFLKFINKKLTKQEKSID